MTGGQGSGTNGVQHDTADYAVCSSSGAPECYIIVHNVAKKHNIGTLARSATAFGTAKKEVIEVLLGRTRQQLSFHLLTRAAICISAMTTGCQIVGVEITDEAKAVNTHPFCGSTAFMIGNEGTGLSANQLKLCDSFVYIPQHGAGTASLNVTVATSIVLHHFAIWAGYAETSRHGYKFDVAAPPQRTGPRGQVPLSSSEIGALKESRQTSAEQDWLMDDKATEAQGESADGVLDAMFDEA